MSRNFSHSIAGFTLLELMLAAAIVSLLMAIAVPSYNGYMDRANIAGAIGDMGVISLRIDSFKLANNDILPNSLADIDMDGRLDPWGNPYEYLALAGVNKGAVRKDKNLNPINTDYDLYSKGKDGESVQPLTAKKSRDDVIRAGNGSFLGLAEDF